MGPVMHVCTLHVQMGDRGAGERLTALVGSESRGKAAGTSLTQDPSEGESGHVSQEAHCVWEMQSVEQGYCLGHFYAKQLLVVYVVL